MGKLVPLPPPRNRHEMEQQIRLLERRIAMRQRMTWVLQGIGVVGAIVVAWAAWIVG